MTEYTKQKLDSKSLVEIKLIAKELKISIAGTKSELIRRILAEFKPQPVLINTHPPKDGKQIVGIKLNDKDRLIQNSSLIEQKKSRFVYYSMGAVYFEVNS